jgi:hypothetical protein
MVKALQSHDGRLQMFCIKSVEKAHYLFPRAHTCFNRIDLPLYSSADELKEHLVAVIEMDIEFSME